MNKIIKFAAIAVMVLGLSSAFTSSADAAGRSYVEYAKNISNPVIQQNFIKEFAHEQNLEIKTICTRIEKIKNQKFDFIICRAFAPLFKLLDYSRFFNKKNTSLLFLKGRSVKNEIHEAKKSFNLEYELYPSQSEGGGYVLKINKYKKL